MHVARFQIMCVDRCEFLVFLDYDANMAVFFQIGFFWFSYIASVFHKYFYET